MNQSCARSREVAGLSIPEVATGMLVAAWGGQTPRTVGVVNRKTARLTEFRMRWHGLQDRITPILGSRRLQTARSPDRDALW